MSLAHSVIRTNVQRARDLSPRRFDQVHFASFFEGTNNLHTEVHLHRKMSRRWVMVKAHVAPIRAQPRVMTEKFPHPIQRWAPRSANLPN
jgi:hypothetical protein